MRRNTWPGLALAGGVIIAALLALLLIGGAGKGDGGLPTFPPPSATRLFPADGEVGSDAGSRRDAKPHRARGAAAVQYGVGGGQGAVLGESDRHP